MNKRRILIILGVALIVLIGIVLLLRKDTPPSNGQTAPITTVSQLKSLQKDKLFLKRSPDKSRWYAIDVSGSKNRFGYISDVNKPTFTPIGEALVARPIDMAISLSGKYFFLLTNSGDSGDSLEIREVATGKIVASMTGATNPGWAKGDQVFYSTYDAATNAYAGSLLSIPSLKKTVVENSKTPLSFSSISPDGSAIVYGIIQKSVDDITTASDIYLYDLPSGKSVDLTQKRTIYEAGWLTNDTIAYQYSESSEADNDSPAFMLATMNRQGALVQKVPFFSRIETLSQAGNITYGITASPSGLGSRISSYDLTSKTTRELASLNEIFPETISGLQSFGDLSIILVSIGSDIFSLPKP